MPYLSHRMVDLNWSAQQIKEDFRKYHPANLVVPFRKNTETNIIKYAESWKEKLQSN